MPIFILSLIIQIALVVHIVKTGRNTTWIWVVVLLPLAGSIAYIIVELLPELLGSRTGRRAKKNISQLLNPNKDIQNATTNYIITDTVENTANLAQECLNKGIYDEAKQLYEKCLTGIHEHEPHLMYGLAQAEYGLGNFIAVRHTLDKLIENNSDYKNVDAHLLYAKSLEKANEIELALKEYEVLSGYYPGPEATVRYAILLKSQGRNTESKALLSDVVQKAKVLGKQYNSMHKEWINRAKAES